MNDDDDGQGGDLNNSIISNVLSDVPSFYSLPLNGMNRSKT